jgi:thiamine biosynthesis lipoprotein
MTVFSSTSTVSKINRMAGEREVAIGPRLFTVFGKAKEIHNLSNGAMDITVGPVMEKWGLWTHQLCQVPTDREIRDTTEKIGMEKLTLNKFTAGLTRSGAKIDLGCIAKGFGVDKAIQALKSNGIESAVVNAGGDLYALGSYPAEDGWLIGITHPLSSENTIVNMKVKNGAVATSGNYQNYISVNNIKYGHIVDPYQGIPTRSREMLSSTIFGTSAMECDGFATACFVQGIEQGIKTAADNNLKYIFIGNFYGGVSVKYSEDLPIIT